MLGESNVKHAYSILSPIAHFPNAPTYSPRLGYSPRNVVVAAPAATTIIPLGYNAYSGRSTNQYAPTTSKAKAQIKLIVRRTGPIAGSPFPLDVIRSNFALQGTSWVEEIHTIFAQGYFPSERSKVLGGGDQVDQRNAQRAQRNSVCSSN
jgi:hypothetical protein